MHAYLKIIYRIRANCGLANSFGKLSNELVYTFPMDTPFKFIYGSIYKARYILAYNGESALFIIQDMLSGYATIKELTKINAASFIRVVMKVIFQHGLCHPFIINAESKFKSIW